MSDLRDGDGLPLAAGDLVRHGGFMRTIVGQFCPDAVRLDGGETVESRRVELAKSRALADMAAALACGSPDGQAAADRACDLFLYLLADALPGGRERLAFWVRIESNACSAQGDARNEILEGGNG